LHEDEEIRFTLEGSGYFDVRDETDLKKRWIRIEVEPNDMIVLPAGMYHRFTPDLKNFIRAMRLFQDEPKWIAFNRGPDADTKSSRGKYLQFIKDLSDAVEEKKLTRHMPNGTSYILASGARALAHYPHMRKVNGFLYVSGTSSRRPDNTHVGATQQPDGTWKLDITEQTRGVLENIERILALAGADRSHLVDLTVYLKDMKYYDEYNKVYNTFFEAATGPTRATIGVNQMVHPNVLIEIKAVAVAPELSN